MTGRETPLRPGGRRRRGQAGCAALALALLIVPAPVNGQADAIRAPGALTLRPAALAALIGQVAGRRVRVPGARIVWVIDSRALVVESDTRLPSAPGHRDRLLVLVERGSLAIPRPPIDTAPVTVLGVARTLLGIQAAGTPPWPAALTRELIDRLEIRGAVLASSVQTPDGIELTSREPAS